MPTERSNSRFTGPCMFGVLLILIAIDVVFRAWSWHGERDCRALAKKLKVAAVQTNGADGIGVVDATTGRPLWVQWNFGMGGNPDCTSFYFEGREVLTILNRPGHRPEYEVLVYDEDGRLEVRWRDRGGHGLFPERTRFNMDGSHQAEVWYENRWQEVDIRDQRYGLTIEGMWRRLTFTNGVWRLQH